MVKSDRVCGWGALSAVVMAILVSGCVNQSTWSPAVDPYNDPNPDRIAQDEFECRQIAQKASGQSTEEAVKGGAVGGLLGAAAGAAIGAAVGAPGTGAAIGAASGGFGGGTYKAMGSDADFKSVFKRCMEGRGHRVLN